MAITKTSGYLPILKKGKAVFKGFVLVVATVLLISQLSGCASMADSVSKMSGLGVVTEEASTFDGATVIDVSPTWLYDPEGSFGNQVKLGARWSSKAPDYVALVMSYNADTRGYSATYMSISGIDINVDGEITSYSTRNSTKLDSGSYNTVTRTIYTESRNTVVIPYAMLEEMVFANDCRLRIHTSKGYEDARFSIERIPGGQGTAILSIQEFMARIEPIRIKK